MRIHTSLDEAAFYTAARAARVSFDKFSRHGSRTHDHAFEVTLCGSSTRRPNPGRGGTYGSDDFAATWDEWGIFLGHLYAADTAMKSWAYANAGQFHDNTDWRFYYLDDTGLLWKDQHRNHNWEFHAPREFYCKGSKGVECSAVRRYSIIEQQAAAS